MSSNTSTGARTITTVSVRERVRAEYNEMPGLCLNLAQAARFWQIDPRSCERVLEELVQDGYLVKGRAGYVRSVR
jgi:hypothetical protein